MRHRLPALVFFLTATTAAAADAPADGFYRYPSIGGGVIVFACEGDLWRVAASGGVAQRLTAHEGEEKFPSLSPDGRLLAFTAQYEGNDDVYVMPATGGEPTRLTYHPMPDQTIGWTADGKILFRSRRDHPHGDYRVYKVAPTGGTAELIPLEPAARVAFEPGGKRVAVQKMGLEFHNWKRYKGGEAEQIEVGTLEPLAVTKVTQYDGKNAFPMWAKDGRIYFVSDRWGRPNLASMRPDGGDVKRLTQFDDYDVRWPAMSDGKIVYQHKMDIWIYDVAGGTNQQVSIVLPSDRLQERERFIDPQAYRGGWSLAPDGTRIALEARGDLFVTRTRKKGLIRRITESSEARTKFPSFSPDGKSVAAWTEVKGEEQLLVYRADNSGAPRQVGSNEPGWHYTVAWSPDGSKLAWGDEKYRLIVADAATGKTTVVDRGVFETDDYTWSPDSRYLAYSLPLANELSQVKIWDSQSKKAYELTDPMVNAASPSWDAKGKYIYYLGDGYINPYLDRFESRFIVDKATLPYVVALRPDAALPFAPRGDAETKDEAKDQAKDDKKKEEEPPKKAEPINIDFAGIRDRLVQVPVPPGNYYRLRAVDGKLHWISRDSKGLFPPPPPTPEPDVPVGDLQTYDIDKEKVYTVTQNVMDYEVSLDRKVLVYQTKDGFVRIDAGATMVPKPEPGKDDMDDPKVDLSGWSMRINPRQEWQQMLRESWRLQRDFFYDTKMHGVDWNAVWKQYGPLAPRIASRDDLEDLLGEMFGELNVGHAYHQPGDLRRGKPVGTGLLGADLTYDAASGFWQIKKIYRGDHPDPKVSSPLARADLRVTPGMWLVAIDGRPLVKGEDYLKRLANRAGQEVELSVNTAAKMDGARRIVVKTVPNDVRIRYETWIRETRDYVDRASKGQIGYIHLYDMGGYGLSQFSRAYLSQWNKRGLIIDDRWNHGGFVATMIAAHLARRLFAVGGTRHGLLFTNPDRVFNGHLALLINRQGGSDCETLALSFKNFKLGPVIGTRTWGGWVGIRGDKKLRDGGVTTQPEFSGWDPSGREWLIEGHGVDPDVELELGPDGFIHGKDGQLDYAIQDLMAKIAKDPRDLPKAPPIRERPLVPLK